MPGVQQNTDFSVALGSEGGALEWTSGCTTCTCGATDTANCACGCTSCAVGGITACDGSQLWPVKFLGSISPRGLTWTWDAMWSPTSYSAPPTLAAFDADTTNGKIQFAGTWSIVGDPDIAQDFQISCGDDQSGYYFKATASNGDVYEFDASGGLPRLDVAYTASVLQQPSGYSPGIVTVYPEFIIEQSTQVTVATDGTVAVLIAPPQTDLGYLVKFDNSGTVSYTANSHSIAQYAGPHPLTGELGLTASRASDTTPSTTGNICDASIASTASVATAAMSETNAYLGSPGIVSRSQVGAKYTGTTPSHPLLGFEIAGSTSANTAATTLGCSTCDRAFHITVTRDSDSVILIDDLIVQSCTSGFGWPYACTWGSAAGTQLIRKGPTWWQVTGAASLNLLGGDCPESITDACATVTRGWVSTANASLAKLVLETYTVSVTAVTPPDTICCTCDEGSPCKTCDNGCEGGDSTKALLWHKTGGDITHTVNQLETSPCVYGDGVAFADSDNSIVFEAYDGVHQARWVATFFDDEDSGLHYRWARDCADGIDGEYLPLDGQTGDLVVG